MQQPGELTMTEAPVTDPAFVTPYQALFDSLPEDQKQGATIVVSGDGRYYNREAIQVQGHSQHIVSLKKIEVPRLELCRTGSTAYR